VLTTTLALIPLLRPLVGWPIAIVGVLFFLPTWESLWLGQINAAVAICTTITLLAVQRKQDVAAGVALAIGTLLKITPGLLIPILVMQRRWRTFVAAVITGLLAVLLSLPAVPIALWWSGSLLALTSNWTSPLLLSWTAMLRQIGGALGTFGPPALGIAMIAMTLWRSRTITLQNALTAMILLPLLISGIVWHYTAIVALPAFAVLWQQGRQARLLAAISWVAITLVGGSLQPIMLSLCWVISCWPQLLGRHHEHTS
ncbi:MAG TPA: glycosyltransferase family 87 protein, partial [Roseiflexaceae bacterium]|nr:glycosyltransferase family 87 protein [Roseiflexaceae bacterium]